MPKQWYSKAADFQAMKHTISALRLTFQIKSKTILLNQLILKPIIRKDE